MVDNTISTPKETVRVITIVKAQKQLTRIQTENQARITAAALTVFARYGYRGSTVDQIADESGMSKANLLYYFKRKQDIYLHVLESTLEEWLQPLQTLEVDGNPEEELWRYIEVKLMLSQRSPEASRLFANEILQGAPMINQFLTKDLKSLVDEKCRVIQCWIDRGQLADIVPLHLLFLIWAATQHYADFRSQINLLTESQDQRLFEDAEKTLKAVLAGLLRDD